MSKRVQLILLSVLLVIFAFALYLNWGRAPQLISSLGGGDTRFTPLDVDSPALKSFLLQRIRETKYPAGRENIFIYRARRVADPSPGSQTPVTLPPVDTGPPPLVPPYRFFGYVMNLPSGNRRGFFQNGEDIFIAAEGETLQNRFRVLRISTNNVEMEELASGRRATVQIEEPPPIA